MKPAAFEYAAPSTLEDALGALAEGGDEAKVLAGGQSLVPLLNFRFARPALLVDLNRIGGLARIERTADGGLTIGALTRTRDLERSPLVRDAAPLLAQAAPLIGHRQIRNRGTVVGSVAHADPAAELPSAVTALGATVVARSLRGERAIPVADFFQTYFTTALAPDEVATEIRIPPRPPRSGSAFVEVSRRHGDFALVAAAAVVTLDDDGRCRDASLALAGVADVPVAANDACAALRGQALDDETLRATAAAVSVGLTPSSDIHASRTYRKEVAETLVHRALAAAAAKAADAEGAAWS